MKWKRITKPDKLPKDVWCLVWNEFYGEPDLAQLRGWKWVTSGITSKDKEWDYYSHYMEITAPRTKGVS